MAYGRNGRVISDRKLDHPLDKKLRERIENIRMTGPIDKYSKKSAEKTSKKNKKVNQNFHFNFRLLPVVVLVVFLVLIIKIPNIYRTVEGLMLDTRVVAYAEAQETRDSEVKKTREVPSGKALKNDLETKDKDEKPLDPVLFTRSEIELLQELSRRRKELDGRERAIIQREGLLMAAESRLEVKINELELIKTDIETLITKYNAQEEEKFKGLVSIYEKMKPKDSARIFDQLDIEILLEVFERMKASKSASILAQMKAARAKEITSRIAEKREMPELGLKK
jgi:flagellar motility protein MotE (MotC chaperone)